MSCSCQGRFPQNLPWKPPWPQQLYPLDFTKSPKNEYSCGFTTDRRVAVGMDKPPSNRPAKFALNLLNLLKEKQQQHAHACRGREYTGLLLFFEFLESPSEARPERSCQQRLEDRSGFPLLSALPSLHRDAMGKVGKGMCQWPNRAPMGRTLSCRRAWGNGFGSARGLSPSWAGFSGRGIP